MKSVIDLETGGPSVLSFRNSQNERWDPGQLVITNWAGALGGGGSDRIYVGNSASGLTPSQLAVILFVNPAGLAPGYYATRILSTGEIVPTGVVIAYTRTNSTFTLTWDSSRFQLLSSTNVAGPYQPLAPDPSSPYAAPFSGPQRFFELIQR